VTSGTKTTNRATSAKDTAADSSAVEPATIVAKKTVTKPAADKTTAAKTTSKTAAAPKAVAKPTKARATPATDDDSEDLADEVEIDDVIELDGVVVELDISDEDEKPKATRSRAKAAPAAEPEGEASESEEEDDDEEDTKPAFSEPLPTGAIVISSTDEDDVPVYSTMITGATADPVKDYLKQIGKVPLLNAAEEVELAMRIEAGLFAEEKLSHMTPAEKSHQTGLDLQWVARDGQRAKSHLLGANLRLVVSLAKRYTGRGMQFLDLIQEGNLG